MAATPGPSLIPRRTSISTGSGPNPHLSRSTGSNGSSGVGGASLHTLGATGLPIPQTASAATRTLKRTSMQAGLAPPSSVSKRHLHPPSTPGPNSSSLAALRADIQASASATTLQRQLLGSQRENNQLNRELGALQERIKSLERERSILLSREEGSQIKEQEEREKVEREKRSLVESLGEYRAKCEELEDELEELKSYQSRLSHDADLAVEEKSSIEKQMEVLQEELGKVDQENAKLKTEHEELVQARETIVQLQKQLAERPQQQQNPGTSEGVAAGDATSTASEGAADSKAPQEVPITEVLRKELHHQVQHLRTLEHTNARLTREVNAFKQDRHNFELLKEEKLSLETKLRHMQTLRRTLTEKELELENLQRERKEWTAFLTSSENEPDRERFESPAQMAKALASCRIEILSLQDKLGSVTASVRSRDSTIEELEERLREVEDELVPQVRKELDEARDRIRSLQRKADLDDKELSMLREQINTYSIEETSLLQSSQLESQPSEGATTAFDKQKSLRISHLEELLQTYKQEISTHAKEAERLRGILESRGDDTQTIDQDVKAVDASAIFGTPSKSKDAIAKRLADQIRTNEELQESLRTAQIEMKELQLDIESLEAQVDTLNHALGRGEYNTATTKVLALADNPASLDLAVRTETLDRLKEENRVLLEKLGHLEQQVQAASGRAPPANGPQPNSGPHEETVPMATYVNLVAERASLQDKIEQTEKSRARLKEIFAKTAQELRDACRSLFGYKIEPLDGGRFKLTTVFGGSEYFLVFGPTTSSSAAASGMNSKFQLVGGNENFVQSQRVQTGLNFWVAERGCVPGFLSSMTLELFEESTRGRTAGWTEG